MFIESTQNFRELKRKMRTTSVRAFVGQNLNFGVSFSLVRLRLASLISWPRIGRGELRAGSKIVVAVAGEEGTRLSAATYICVHDLSRE